MSSEFGDNREDNGSFPNNGTDKQNNLSTHEVTELHCGKRGRPMRLGKVKYDINKKFPKSTLEKIDDK